MKAPPRRAPRSPPKSPPPHSADNRSSKPRPPPTPPPPQIFFRNRVRSPTIRISRNRLPITEIDNDQQNNDRESQRHNVANAQQSQRQQNRQRRLRPVSRRAQ